MFRFIVITFVTALMIFVRSFLVFMVVGGAFLAYWFFWSAGEVSKQQCKELNGGWCGNFADLRDWSTYYELERKRKGQP